MLNSKFVIVSYYTPGTGYEIEVKRLIASCRHFGLDHCIVPLRDRGSWIQNVNLKPGFCLQMLEQHKKPIVFVDADAVIRQYPVYFDHLTASFAVYFRFQRELLSGTLFFNHTEHAKNLLELWIKYTVQCSDQWDQRTLSKAHCDYMCKHPSLSWVHLPETYCQIFDAPECKEYPVIEHYQASRRLKK